MRFQPDSPLAHSLKQQIAAMLLICCSSGPLLSRLAKSAAFPEDLVNTISLILST